MRVATSRQKKKEVAVLRAEEITEEFIARCERHLATLHHTLWGKAFNVYDLKERRIAAEWLASQIVAVMILPTEED